MTDSPRFVGVDWGTSALRIWLLTADGKVLSERRSDEGMGRLTPGDFAGVLDAHLADMDVPGRLPVLMCGMVGARQGWLEAPYADCPVALAGLAQCAVRLPDKSRDMRILPGIAQRDRSAPDVMRGEETKLLGLSRRGQITGLVCLPGTHAKWAAIERGTVTRFRTTMAGELFAVLSAHSLLRMSVSEAPAASDPTNPDFQRGLMDGLASSAHMTSLLFQLRAGSLLFEKSGAAVASRLSGLLIGAAVADGLTLASQPVTLVADGALAPLYAAGLAAAGRRHETVDASDAVRAGLTLAAQQLWPNP